jgi:hypothetical protein
MYRCYFCKAVVSEGVAAHRVVLKTRRAEYPRRFRMRANKKDRNAKRPEDPGGNGYEIVKEVLACRSCAAEHSEGTGAENRETESSENRPRPRGETTIGP